MDGCALSLLLVHHPKLELNQLMRFLVRFFDEPFDAFFRISAPLFIMCCPHLGLCKGGHAVHPAQQILLCTMQNPEIRSEIFFSAVAHFLSLGQLII
jgi:hypothetical protein